MSISDKLQELLDIKQDIKVAIENKGVDLTGVDFGGYAGKIDEIQTGGEDITYADYVRTLYSVWGKSNQFATAWEHSLTVDTSEISVNSSAVNQRGKAQYPNGETEGVIIPQGVTSIGNSAFNGWSSNNQPLVISQGVTSIGNSSFSGWTSNNQPLVIPNSVISIGGSAFSSWTSNNQPLVIPNSVISIVDSFLNWTANNQPLVIPNTVTSIGNFAFLNWSSNTHPLVIPNSVTSIGTSAFSGWALVPYVEVLAITPPSLANANAFGGQNNAQIYVPDESVNAYKTATNWASLASRIFSINDK